MTRRKTHEQFIKEVQELVGNDYSVLGTYVRTATKIKMKHNLCGTEWSITPNNFLRGRRCPTCSHVKTQEEFSQEVINSHDKQFVLVGTYKGCDTKTKYKCINHEVVIYSTPTIFMRTAYPCSKCLSVFLKQSNRKPQEQFIKELNNRHQGRIQAVEPYVNTHTKIRFLCNECNNYFYAEPNSVLRLSGCPYCAYSKGETYIASFLTNHKIKFKAQYRFENCKFIRPLPFDFYIPNSKLLIEFDGKQHTTPIQYFGGLKAYISQLKRDSIKNEFAKDNNLRLLRISYTLPLETIDKLITLNL